MALAHAVFALIASTATGTAAAHDPPARPAGAARHRPGMISNRDYPASALRDRAEGASVVDILVGPDGRVTGCTVIESAGHSALDFVTCSLVQRRFRFVPAVDSTGHPTSDRRTHSFAWRLPAETPASPGDPPASD